MKRLFKVLDSRGQRTLWATKPDAKRFRDKLDAKGQKRKVMRGPDHWKGETFA